METTAATSGIQVHASVHAVFSIPETLAQIIGHTVHVPSAPEREDLLSDDTKGRIAIQTQTPWPYLPVCKRWYNVIQSTSALWSTFVAICTINSEHLRYIIPMLDAHLQRSKNAPLTLVIHLSPFHYSEVVSRNGPGTVCADLAKMVLREQHRWKEVDLDVSGKDTTPLPDTRYPLALSVLQDSLTTLRIHWRWGIPIQLGPCPLLESLDLLFDSSADVIPSVDYEKTKMKEYFPRLRTVRLYCEGVLAFGCAWTIVAHLCAAPIEELEIRAQVLRQHDDITLSIPPLRFATLRRLCLQIRPFTITRQLLTHLDLPSLTELELAHLVLSNETLAGLAPLLAKFRLETLEMGFTWEIPSFESDMLGEFLQSLGGVRLLSLRRMDTFVFPSNLITLLTMVFSQDQEVLPLLSSLHLNLEPLQFYPGGSGDISFVRDLISICKRKYVKFHFAFSSKITGQNRTESTVTFLRELLDDELIRSYVTEDFRITFNGVDVVGELGADTSTSM